MGRADFGTYTSDLLGDFNRPEEDLGRGWLLFWHRSAVKVRGPQSATQESLAHVLAESHELAE